ncbi:hypothetical protein RhiirA1_480903 [Rhizophagus irregularis]|uniref:Uncharacterized protein n=1 Tax=Rhizophagus irregularis TaxID=588596 RepID=A0A2N0QNS1_9GLOM|nr:hypothetical protein RhiirA1_480903 [Rhizophagus irregularis]
MTKYEDSFGNTLRPNDQDLKKERTMETWTWTKPNDQDLKKERTMETWTWTKPNDQDLKKERTMKPGHGRSLTTRI